MRFERLELSNFKAIVSAELELGPGLNVLYGPNDLGKSTLGVALRAALLLPSASSAAAQYVPWQEPSIPVVSLTFLDDSARFWKVVKRFTENDASLASSKDGRDFSVEARERAVDDRLRKLLGWGIASPGGRGGPKGMPESFLANVLLAAQADVDAILARSLAGDAEASGKLALTRALSALAQDPLVRQVLAAAQKEYDLHFTATGKVKSGQGAPLTQASEAVKAITDELLDRQRALTQSVESERTVHALREAWLEKLQQTEAAQREAQRAQEGLARAGEKRAAAEQLASARAALAQVETLAVRLRALEAEQLTLGREASNREAALAAAQQRREAAAAAVRQQEEAVRKASSAEGEAERAVARAAVREALSTHAVARAELTARLAKAVTARKAAQDRATLQAQLQRVDQLLGPARAVRTQAQSTAELSGALLDYGHWRQASEAAQRAEQWRAEVKAVRAQALEKAAAALGTVQRAQAQEAELSVRRGLLPEPTLRASLERLRREADLAEAALGGGVTVLVRPKGALLLYSTRDESPAEERKVTTEVMLEADRRVQLSIGNLVELEVLAGAADKRKDAEHLRKRWKAEALPALERAGVRTLAELGEVLAALEQEEQRAKALRLEGAQLEREAEALRARAAMLEEKASGALTPQQLEERRARIGAAPLEGLRTVFETLGADWEAQARPHHDTSAAALAEATARVQALEAERTLTEHRLADVKELGAAEDVRPLEQELAALEAAQAADQQRLALLERERTGALEGARAQLQQASAQLTLAEADLAAARAALTQAQAAASARRGERDATAAQLAAADGAAAAARVEAASAHLARYDDVELLSPEALAARERAVEGARAAADQAGREFAAAEGALSGFGGPQAREQVRQLEEALTVARAREHHVEVEGKAWMLLVEAVREAEREDSASLGKALAGPVGERFAQLTQGRYPTVRFDAELGTSGVDVSGTPGAPEGVLEGLSVGTRDHLATLVRLAIAQELGSAIVLDDHLVHSDVARLAWFRQALAQTAAKTQVLVLTCRPLDYVTADELPSGAPFKNVGARTRVVDLAQIIKRR